MVAQLPLLIVGSYRDDERPLLPDELPQMQVMTLARLTNEEMVALAVSMLGQVGEKPEIMGYLHRETEGNAFFLVEVVRALAEQAGRLSQVGQTPFPPQIFPQGIRSIVQRRLDKIVGDDRLLLVLAAVNGRFLDESLLQTLAPAAVQIPQWLERCANAAVLEVYDDVWRFAHDKLREGVLDGLHVAERKQYHQRVAEALVQTYPDDEERAANLAYHWREGGVADKERHYVALAGMQAMARFVPVEAIAHLQRAEVLYEQAGLPTPFALRNGIARAFWMVGRLGDALATYESLLADAEAVDDLATGLEARYGILHVYHSLGALQEALTMSEETEQLLRAINKTDDEDFAHILWSKGTALRFLGHLEEATALANESLALSQALDYKVGIANSYNLLATIFTMTGQIPIAEGYARQSLAGWQALGHRLYEAELYNNVGETLRLQGKYEEAAPFFELSIEMHITVGTQLSRATPRSNLGAVALALGHYDEAVKHLQQALDDSGEGTWLLAETYSYMAQAYIKGGKLIEAFAITQTLWPFVDDQDPLNRAFVWHAMALMAAELGGEITMTKGDVMETFTPTMCYEKTLLIFEETGVQREMGIVLWSWATYAFQQNERALAEAKWAQARQIFVDRALTTLVAQMDIAYDEY